MLAHSNSKHEELMKRMSALGYTPDSGGICAGFTGMGMQAILAGEVKTFNDRVTLINKIPLESFENLNAITFKALIEKWNKLFPDEKEMIETIPAFFDGMQIYISENHKSLSDLPSAPLSLALEKAGGIKKVNEITGMYEQEELVKLFSVLETSLSNLPNTNQDIFVLTLGSLDHVISIGYNNQNKTWYFCNANFLETQEPIVSIPINDQSKKILANKIFRAFAISSNFEPGPNNSFHGVAALTIEAITTNEPQEEVVNLLNQWMSETAISITPKKAQQKDTRNGTWLLIAAEKKDLETVRNLMKQGADINKPIGSSGRTILEIFARNQALVNIIDSFQTDEMELYIAINTGNVERAEHLLNLNKEIDLNTLDGGENFQDKPLALAIKQNNPAMVNLLLSRGAKVNEVYTDGTDISTPLTLAAKAGQIQILNSLLGKGADVNLTKDQHSPLYLSAMSAIGGPPEIYEASKEICKVLIDKGADPIFTSIKLRKKLEEAQSNSNIEKYKEILSIYKPIQMQANKVLACKQTAIEKIKNKSESLFAKLPQADDFADLKTAIEILSNKFRERDGALNQIKKAHNEMIELIQGESNSITVDKLSEETILLIKTFNEIDKYLYDFLIEAGKMGNTRNAANLAKETYIDISKINIRSGLTMALEDLQKSISLENALSVELQKIAEFEETHIHHLICQDANIKNIYQDKFIEFKNLLDQQKDTMTAQILVKDFLDLQTFAGKLLDVTNKNFSEQEMTKLTILIRNAYEKINKDDAHQKNYFKKVLQTLKSEIENLAHEENKGKKGFLFTSFINKNNFSQHIQKTLASIRQESANDLSFPIEKKEYKKINRR